MPLYEVTIKIEGSTTYKVWADSKEQAGDRAEVKATHDDVLPLDFFPIECKLVDEDEGTHNI